MINVFNLLLFFTLHVAGIPKDALPEIPRQISFCNYTMLVKNDDDVFVIPDTLEDDRFSGNFFVTTALFLRFYAGVPLVSPEGCRLGTFCILDLKPRPDGMSDSEKESLRDLAKIAVDYLVSRREQNMGEKRVEFASQMLARAANDLRTPLHGVQLSLAMMQENFYTNDLPVTMTPDKVSNSFGQENSVSYAQKDCLDTARACTNMIGDICNTLRPQEDDAPALGGNCQVTLLLEEPNSNRSSSKSQEFATTTNNEATLRRDRSDSICSTLSDSKSSLASICDVRKLMKSLISMVEYIPKQVPVLLKVDKSVPHHVLAEQLPIFRATLNLLSLSCDRAVTGNIEFVVRTRMEDNFNSSNALYFECIDYGPPFELCDLDDNTDSTDSNNCDDVLGGKTSQNVLLQNFEKPTLSSINAIVRSLGGGIGYTSLLEDKRGQMDREVSTIPTMLNIRPTTKFWFKIPLLFPEYSFDNSAVNIDNDPAIDKKEQTDTSQLAAGSSELNETQPRTSTVLNSDKTCNESNEPSMRTIPKGRALIIDDSVIIRKTLTRALSGLGYSCTVAEDGLVGLKHLQSSTYDVVLCDFLMPVMDGLDCVREYRQWEQSNRQNFRQYFVGMSAHGNTRDGEKAKRLGMDRFEPKPISLQTLHDIANEVHYRKLSDADAACGTDEYNEGLEQPSDKLYQTDSAKGEEFTCLIGACQRTLKEIGQIAIDAGHFPMLVDNIYDLVQKMKSRNWSVVMIDELLVQSNRADVLQEFRDWESLFRFHRQKEVYLITQFNVDACDNHSKSTASILLPSGVDDVVEYPGDSDKILHIFQAAKEGRPVAAGDIIVS